ncbi:MAG: hypothetical protein ACU84H_16975 [Gammaproteobacteria bacterium]
MQSVTCCLMPKTAVMAVTKGLDGTHRRLAGGTTPGVDQTTVITAHDQFR